MFNMQFREFIFPFNPASITVERLGRHAVFFCPGYGQIVQSLGDGKRQVLCAGDFVCATPSQSVTLIASFEEKCADGKPGVLILPGMSPMIAVLAQHSFQSRGDGRVTPYTMRFLEAGGI